MKQLFKESIWILVLFVYIFDRYIDKGLNYHTNISEVEFLKCSTIFCSYLLQLVFIRHFLWCLPLCSTCPEAGIFIDK